MAGVLAWSSQASAYAPAHPAWLDASVPAARTGAATLPLTSASLLAIYALAFDTPPANTTSLGSLAPDTLEGIQQASAGDPGKKALVLVDLYGPDNTYILVIGNGVITPVSGLPDSNGILSSTLNEYDMAASAAMGGFLKWALDSQAAASTTVVLSYIGHGIALAPAIDDIERIWATTPPAPTATPPTTASPLPVKKGVHPSFTDHTPRRSLIAPEALAAALDFATSGGQRPIASLNLVHCFAATIEELYALRPYVATMTGSPNYTYFDPGMPGQALSALSPALSAGEIASATIQSYDAVLAAADDPATAWDDHPRLLVAVDSSRLQPVVEAWDTMSFYILEGLAQDSRGTREKIQQAYAPAGKYDSTFCNQDWECDTPDALVDMANFAQGLNAAFGATSPVGTWATTATARLQAAVIASQAADGVPWFAAPLTPTWHLEGRSGIGLFADFQGITFSVPASGSTPVTYLSLQAQWYTDTVSADNPFPYKFVQDTRWDQALARFWEGTRLQSLTCLPNLPPATQPGELSVEHIIAPLPGTAKQGAPVWPSAAIHTAHTVKNPQLSFAVVQSDTLVFWDAVGLGDMVTGTHQVEASQLWVPSVSGPFTLTVTVDPDDRVVETDEEDNVWTIVDDVWSASWPRPILTASTSSQQQWLATIQPSLELAQDPSTWPLAQSLAIQVYQYTTSTQVATAHLLGEQIWHKIALPLSPFTLTLPLTTAPGPLVLHIWGWSAGGWSQRPAVVEFNYVPPATPILSGTQHTYLMELERGDDLTLALDVATGGDANLFVWDPYTGDSPAWQAVKAGDDVLTIDPAPFEGRYILGVYGQTSATYTLTVVHDGQPGLAQTTGSDHLVAYVPPTRPAFIPPIYQVPAFSPVTLVYLPLIINN
ncbi:MAG: hypothetical protein JW850_16410 [Thermoflexales bacterium]|nr:hypothetical protein [Thermoflexales bacterium]